MFGKVMSMIKKGIIKVGTKTEWRISLAKRDNGGNPIREGECYILYPEELEELQQAKEKVQGLTEEINNLKTQINTLTTTHETDKETLQQLKGENTRKDEAIKQLQKEKDNLSDEVDGLKQSLTSIKIRDDEEINTLTNKYNKSVDFIHSLISTSILIQTDIKDMSFTKRAFNYKNNINSIYKERNMHNLLKEHLIQEETCIPERILEKK